MDGATIWRVWLPLVGSLCALGWLFQSGPGPQRLARSISLLLGLIGLAGVILSRYTLGRSFSVVPKATELVTSGIYSRIRNPIYVFGVIFLVGLALIVGRPVLLIVLLVLIPVQIIRARREAAVLEAKFRRRLSGIPQAYLVLRSQVAGLRSHVLGLRKDSPVGPES